MAPRSRIESTMAQASASHLVHRYVDGLRFDGVWEYQVLTSSGRIRWKALPLLEAPSTAAQLLDAQGAWWCVQRCAAFMSQRVRLTVKLSKGHTPCPQDTEVAQALKALLPDCEVQIGDSILGHSVEHLAAVLEERGSALLRLERSTSSDSLSCVCWLWVVGIEAQYGVKGQIRALLVVGPRWPAPWGSGFGAKVFPYGDGYWRLSSVDGEVMHARVTACIAAKRVVRN